MRQVAKNKREGNIRLEYCDIRAALDHVGVSYTETGKNVSAGWVGVQCPMPGCSDVSNHMGLNLNSPVASCYHCGAKGNYLTYMAAEVGSWGKAIDVLQKYIPRELRTYQNEFEESYVSHVDLPPEATKTPLKYHTEYLKGRGFDPKELDIMYDLYYCGPTGDWANRIIVPIYRHNKLVTFTSVDIAEDSGLRYKHLKKELSIIHCKNNLYGIEQCLGRVMMVVEGYFDKLRIGPGCVCTFGTKVTPEQKKLMVGFSKIIIVFDGDLAGWKNGRQLANDISAFTEVELVTLEEGQDPDSLPNEDVLELKQMVKTKW